ncbi:polyketide synthase [Streptomyces sp. NPDC057137]|uniref:beta-ketoacyl [acyl carrier protein] synthase domain-containing protein n=1 Tax=Streptomyces sp. NPDC057137 TaxID=3346030 RepID=UPI00362CF668
MDAREILVRYKEGSLDRRSASQLLGSLVADEADEADEQGTTGESWETWEDGGPPPPESRSPQVVPGDPAAPLPGTAGDPPAPTAPHRTAGDAPGLAPDGTTRHAPGLAPDGIAVVGLAGRYPQATDLAAFWQNLREGRDTATDVPPARPGAPLTSGGERGYFLDGVDQFDPEFFGLGEDEARLMDPQERLFLETACEALEDAGGTGARLDALTGGPGQPRAVGVFVGAGSADYALLGAEAWARGHRETPRGGHWGMARRLSGLLGLTGPAHAVDAGWSSGLVAVHLAVRALRGGECAMAVAGGVELLLHPSRARSGAGEGVGAVVLRPLRDAVADGDRVYAVLRTTSAGASAPRSPATGREPASVGLRETRAATVRRIGDAGAATGIAALTSAVLQLRHGVLAPVRDGADASPWQGPRRAVVELLPEPGGDPGGLRADVVLEEYAPREPDVVGSPRRAPAEADTEHDEAVLLSAPTPRHLAATARRLLGRLDEPGPAVDLPALARGLRTGRSAHPCRMALFVRDVPQLRAALRAFLHGEEAVDPREGGGGDPLGLSALPETADYLAALWRSGRVEQVTRLWLSGVTVDWAALEAPSGDPSLVTPLPAPVFLRRSLWLSGAEPGEQAG